MVRRWLLSSDLFVLLPHVVSNFHSDWFVCGFKWFFGSTLASELRLFRPPATFWYQICIQIVFCWFQMFFVVRRWLMSSNCFVLLPHFDIKFSFRFVFLILNGFFMIRQWLLSSDCFVLLPHVGIKSLFRLFFFVLICFFRFDAGF